MISGNVSTEETSLAVTRYPVLNCIAGQKAKKWSLCALPFPLFSLLPQRRGAFPISLLP